ncbi:porin family protein [Chitinophaga nivalis]|uniref:Porin family protein n=1 Tax=Chitinophaga nivalis TaxID=2991709 RepID=A0ABT3IL79_9BACT|nr:porin family protein [Chitinophaga nivalis]MCW3465579.1 porin family protein [Chitinophaga nivalis]MCW3484730.1 porin family protein [Chitinophaga nivalis]
MKQHFFRVLTLANLLLAVHSQAQVKKNYVSGAVGFRSTKENKEGSAESKVSSFNISPSYGRYLNERFSIGLAVGYYQTKSSGEPNPASKTTGWQVAPFIRYEQPLWNSKFSIYNDVQLQASFSKSTIDIPSSIYPGKSTSFGIYYTPGLLFNVTPRVAVTGNLGSLLYLTHSTDKMGDIRYKKTETSGGISSGFGLNNVHFGFLFRF